MNLLVRRLSGMMMSIEILHHPKVVE